jgi:hypothetical protein
MKFVSRTGTVSLVVALWASACVVEPTKEPVVAAGRSGSGESGSGGSSAGAGGAGVDAGAGGLEAGAGGSGADAGAAGESPRGGSAGESGGSGGETGGSGGEAAGREGQAGDDDAWRAGLPGVPSLVRTNQRGCLHAERPLRFEHGGESVELSEGDTQRLGDVVVSVEVVGDDAVPPGIACDPPGLVKLAGFVAAE